MSRILYNPSTNQFYPYPRLDDESVVGLDPSLYVLEVVEAAQPAFDPLVESIQPVETLDLETRTLNRSWEVVSQPQWLSFNNAIGSSVEVNTALANCLQNAPALFGSLCVGLGQAATLGDQRTFLQAWSEGKEAGLIPTAVVNQVKTFANDFNLPESFTSLL